MKSKSKLAFGSLCASVVTVGALALPAASQAAVPGDLCTIAFPGTKIETSVFTSYQAFTGSTVRIVAYAGAGSYKGHTEGRLDGTFPRTAVIQSTCH